MKDGKGTHYYTVVFDKTALKQQQSMFSGEYMGDIKQMPTLDIPNFEQVKTLTVAEDDEQVKSTRRYVHWSFSDNLQLLLHFIVLESLDFSKVQELFQQRDMHACRVKWTNDLMRFTAKGVFYSWKTFLVGMVLDFHVLAAVKSHPSVSPQFGHIKSCILTTIYSLDYMCFMTSTDYRQQIANLIITIYKENLSIEELDASFKENPKNLALGSLLSMLKTESFSLLREMPRNTKAYDQFLKDTKRKAAKVVFE